MKKILIVGSGLAGLSAAITVCKSGAEALMISPLQSERAQSVMAAGGLNAVISDDSDDSPEKHASDTMRSGSDIACYESVLDLCRGARDIADWMDKAGTVFTRSNDGSLSRRLMAGQSKARTLFSGSCTGKQLVSAAVREARKYEAAGKLIRRSGSRFVKLLKTDSACCGGIFYDELKREIYCETASAVILCTGGMNLIFGKTTGSVLCDGSAAAAVFKQGVKLKNLEMIQYHPTTITTPQKQMLITEAARGEGGRLFYNNDDGARVYFMEDKYGPNGNLQTRDVVSREIFSTNKQVYLDITFLGDKLINTRLREVKDICFDYLGLDVTKEPIPVSPCAHYFMGGISVGRTHNTSLPGLYAAGECASIYHGANRLGGNSLLGALYGGRIAALSAVAYEGTTDSADIQNQTEVCKQEFFAASSPDSSFPSIYILNAVTEILNTKLGIVRDESSLTDAIDDNKQYIEMAASLKFDLSDDPFHNYMIKQQLWLAYAVILSAYERKESRGAHYRSDYPEKSADFEKASYAYYANDSINITFERDTGQS